MSYTRSLDRIHEFEQSVAEELVDETVWALMRPIASEAMMELIEEHLGARWFEGLLTELIMPEIPHIITEAAEEHLTEEFMCRLVDEVVSVELFQLVKTELQTQQTRLTHARAGQEAALVLSTASAIVDKLALLELMKTVGTSADAQLIFAEMVGACVDRPVAAALAERCIATSSALDNYRAASISRLPLDILCADLILDALEVNQPAEWLQKQLVESHPVGTPRAVSRGEGLPVGGAADSLMSGPISAASLQGAGVLRDGALGPTSRLGRDSAVSF